VIFFGLTGLSFNHPTVGRGLPVVRASASEVQSATGFDPWTAATIARSVVADLRDQGFDVNVNEEHRASFSGWPLFVGRAPQGMQVATLSLEQGWTVFTNRTVPGALENPPFADAQVTLPEYSLSALAPALGMLAESKGVALSGPFKPHPTVHPEVRLVVQDGEGRNWNVVYDMVSGGLSGRLHDASRGESLVELLESIHKQHHFPPQRTASFVWALLADLTAITLLLWAVTGLIMWWQMKKLRQAGWVVLLLSLLVAGGVFASTVAELTFGVPQAEGP